MAAVAAPAAGALLCTGPQVAVCAAVGAVVGLGLLGAWAMSQSADDKAEENLSSSTSEENTCDGCEPPPRCQPLYADIQRLTTELATRRAAMLADRPVSEGGLGMYDLHLRDPTAKVPDPRGIRPNLGNWIGHRQQIIEKQTRLRSQIALYRGQGCSPLPLGAETQAYLDPPNRPH